MTATRFSVASGLIAASIFRNPDRPPPARAAVHCPIRQFIGHRQPGAGRGACLIGRNTPD
jgi:hypothetical protein